MSKEFMGALFEWVGGILIAGVFWGGVYLVLQGIEYFSVQLGDLKYLLYIALGVFSLILVFETIAVVWNAIKGILGEVGNFADWAIGCVVHMKVVPYVSNPLRAARQARERKEKEQVERKERDRRNALRTKFLRGMSLEEKERYDQGYRDTYQKGLKDGIAEGKQMGHDDGYSHRQRQY